jgi:hypothetical protein
MIILVFFLTVYVCLCYGEDRGEEIVFPPPLSWRMLFRRPYHGCRFSPVVTSLEGDPCHVCRSIAIALSRTLSTAVDIRFGLEASFVYNCRHFCALRPGSALVAVDCIRFARRAYATTLAEARLACITADRRYNTPQQTPSLFARNRGVTWPYVGCSRWA